MSIRISQNQLEVIRSKYLLQNKSLAQRNSQLMMKCDNLEKKVSQLLRENKMLKNNKLIDDKKYENKLIELENLVENKLREVLGYIEQMKPEPLVVPIEKEIVKDANDEITKKQEEERLTRITEEEEEEEEELISTPVILEANVEKDVTPVPAVVPQEEETEIVQASSTPNVSPVKIPKTKRNSEIFHDLTLKLKENEKQKESDLLIDRPRSKRRRNSEVNYKLPSLKHKMRRSSGKWYDAVYSNDDDLIVVDKRRDSFGKWVNDKKQDENANKGQEVKPRKIIESVGKENIVEQEKIQKKPLGDITKSQNIQRKEKHMKPPLSVFDFIEEDNYERKTIFNKSRRNSII